jgi:hypothetical protein
MIEIADRKLIEIDCAQSVNTFPRGKGRSCEEKTFPRERHDEIIEIVDRKLIEVERAQSVSTFPRGKRHSCEEKDVPTGKGAMKSFR